MSLQNADFQLDCYGVDIVMQFANPITSRSWLGYALRGMLGRSLFDSVCINAQPRCEQCALRDTCAYPQVFKPAELGAGVTRLPAYVVHDWSLDESRYSIRFSVLIFGTAVSYLEGWLQGLLRQNGELNLAGAKQGRIVKISDFESSAPLMHGQRLMNTVSPIKITHSDTSHVVVKLQTLTATKHIGDQFLFAALRTRLRRLLADYGQGDWRKENVGWVVQKSDLKKYRVQVNEKRQLNGVIGQLSLVDIHPDAFALLSLGQFTHVGRDCVAGLGRIRLIK